MQVSSVDAPQQTGSEKSQNQPSAPASGMFAALLKGATGQESSVMRLESGSGLAQQITGSEPQPPADQDFGATETDDTSNAFDADDSDTASKEEDRPDEPADEAGTGQTPGAQDAGIAGKEGNAAIAAVSDVATATTSGNVTASTAGQSEIAAAQPEIKATAQNAQAQQTSASSASAQATTQAGAPEQKIASAIASTLINAQPVEKQSSFNRLSASVSDSQQQLVSRPANTLAAVATVTAQAGKQANATAQPTNFTESRAEGTGNLLLNNNPSRAAGPNNAAQNNSSAAQTAAANVSTAGTGDASANIAGQTALPAAALPASQIGANANRPLPVAVRGAELLPLEAGSSFATSGSSANAAARAVAPPTQPTVPPRVLTEQIAVQVQKAVAQGQDRITIQLKPAELGRVEIRLDVMQDGRVAATIVAERPETLDLLQRDARGLQQALQDAGLKANNGSLSFNLGGGNGSNGQQDGDGNGASGSGQPGDAGETAAESDSASEPRRASNSMIDVEV